MAGKSLLLDPSTLDHQNIVADIEEIRRCNPQRYEMEQLTAIIHEDLDQFLCAGYKDITREEFWVRGHMPGMPIMPGVLMCEAAAQLCCYYTQKLDLFGAKVVGFGGIEDVRFREPVVPGDRLVIVGKLVKIRRGAMVVSQFQGFVGDSLVVDGTIKGIALPDDIPLANPSSSEN